MFASAIPAHAVCTAANGNANVAESTPNSDLTDNGDGTVTHAKTGLMWKQCSAGQSGAGCATGAASWMTWQDALKAANTANTAVFAGYSDWRLPNVKELESIVESCGYFPAINQTKFPLSPWHFWSASSYVPEPTYAWFVFFYDGNTDASAKTDNYYVRLVRGGQSFDSFDALGDVTAPVLSAIGVSGTTSTATTLSATSNENATGYWVVVARSATAPTAAQVKAGVTYGAVTVVASGNGAMTAAVVKNFAVAGLSAGTNYDLYLVAEDTSPNANLSTVGAAVQFTTVGFPTATSSAASGVTASGATLNGSVNDNGAITTVTFDYGLTTAYLSGNVAATTPGSGTVGAGAGSTAVAVDVLSLTCNTTYHFRVNGVNSVGTTNGGDLSFTTSACPTYSVIYNGNTNTGGSVPVDGAAYATGAMITVLGNTGSMVKVGYTFVGWNTAANGSGAAYVGGSNPIMGSANVTLYAQWAVGPVDGVCGSANGTTSPFAPQANLCTTGIASNVTSSTGTYGWYCSGSNGGNQVACSANWQSTGAGLGTSSVVGNTRVFAPQGNGALQTSGFIPVTGHPKSPPNLPAGYSFPQGLFDFVLTTGTVGSTATVTITYPSALPAGAVYWKYGPSPAGNNCSGAACAAAHWYQFPAVISGNTATLTITDGGLGDDDLTANGVILDQGGPGLPAGAGAASSIPTLSEWGMILLAGLLGLFGMVGVRRRVAA